MAEINLERKQGGGGMGWLWALIALVVIALIAWWLWPDDEMDTVDDPVGVETVEPREMQPAMPDEEGLALITSNPSAWMDMPFPPTEATVGDRMTDRGFFIEADGAELMVLIVDQPREVPMDINPGQRLRITGGTLRGADYMNQVEGDPLTPETRSLVQEQEIYLVVDEANITILERGMSQGTAEEVPGAPLAAA